MSPNGTYIATGSNDRKVILWDAKTGIYPLTSGTQTGVLTGALQGILSCGFNSTSDLAIASSSDHSVKIWDIDSKRLKHSLTGHIAKVTSAKFLNPTQVYSGSHDRCIKIWDLQRGFCVNTLYTISSCNDVVALDAGGYDFIYKCIGERTY